jgi:hypothetical protein
MSPALIARRRAAKAQRRKALVREKRVLARVDAGRLPAERAAASAARLPITHCLIQDGLFDRGNGIVLLVRKAPAGGVTFAGVLVDAFCLGIKDVAFGTITEKELELYIEAIGMEAPLEAADPSHARKLLAEAAAYGASLGFAPHRDYALAEALFGDVPAECPDAEFTFGSEGKPFYIPGPSESPTQIRRRFEQLRQRLGDGGFHFLIPLDVEAEDDFIDYDDDDVIEHAPAGQLDNPVVRSSPVEQFRDQPVDCP